jgi:hypothetical protein
VRLLAAAAGCLFALVLGAGMALWAERPAPSHFRLVRGGSNDAIWRLNDRTGQVSVCGTALTGRGLSEMEARLAAHIRAAGHDAGKLRALLPEIDELNALARPRCSLWSVDETRAELDMNAAE